MKLGSFSTPNLSFPKPKLPKFKSPKNNSITNSLKKYNPANMFKDIKGKVPEPIKKHIPDSIGKGLDVEKIIGDKTGDVEGILSKNNKTDEIISSFSSQNITDFLPNNTFDESKKIFSKAFSSQSLHLL